MRKTSLRVTAILGLGLAAACGGGDKNNARKLTIAAVLDRTGASGTEQYGEALTLGAQNLNAALKASGAFPDIKIDYDWQDNVSSGTIGADEAATLVGSGAKGIVADNSAVTLGILDQAYDADPSNDLNVPVVAVLSSSGLFNNPTATDPDPTNQAAYRDANKWHYSIVLPTNGQSPALIDLSRHEAPLADGDVNGDGVWKISIHASDDPLGNSFSNAVKAGVTTLAASTGQTAIVEIVKFPASANVSSFDWSSQLDKLVDNLTEGASGPVVDKYPDIILTACLAQFSAALVKQYAARHLSTPPMVHMSAFYNDNIFATLSAGEAEGMIGTTHAVWDRTEEGAAIRAQYEAKFGRTIANTTFTSSKTYDAMMLMTLGHFQAAATNGVSAFDVTGEQVRDAIGTLNDPAGTVVGPTVEGLTAALNAIAAGEAINFQGASAALDFDANRRIRTRVDVFHVQGSGFDIESNYYYDCTNPTCPRVE